MRFDTNDVAIRDMRSRTNVASTIESTNFEISMESGDRGRKNVLCVWAGLSQPRPMKLSLVFVSACFDIIDTDVLPVWFSDPRSEDEDVND